MTAHRVIAALRAPRTFVVVYRDRFELHLWRKGTRGYVRRKFPIAVGKIGAATPGGVYYVDAKSKRPSWTVPKNEDYDPKTWGTVIPYSDSGNPFAGGFLSISGGEGVGIHGTRSNPRLGTRASHGCIRMKVSDFRSIYPKVGLGSLVHVV